MTPTIPENPTPGSFGYKTVFVEIDIPPRELTAEDLARPRLGRPARLNIDPEQLTDEQTPNPS